MSELRSGVFVSDGVRRNRTLRLPDGGPIVSSQLVSTLIFGERDSVLVDPRFTHEQIGPAGLLVHRFSTAGAISFTARSPRPERGSGHG
jgi:hypothetical protein